MRRGTNFEDAATIRRRLELAGSQCCMLVDERMAGIILGGPDKPISAKTLQAWRLRNFGPPVTRVGRLCRYSVESLKSWLGSQTK